MDKLNTIRPSGDLLLKLFTANNNVELLIHQLKLQHEAQDHLLTNYLKALIDEREIIKDEIREELIIKLLDKDNTNEK